MARAVVETRRPALLILPLTRLFAWITTEGLENLRGIDGPVIFAANHQSHFDVPSIFWSLPSQWRYHAAPAMSKEFFDAHLSSGAPFRGRALRQQLKLFPIDAGVQCPSPLLRSANRARATLLPRVRRLLSADAIIGTASGVFVATLTVLALVKSPFLIIPMLVAGGFAWTSAMSTLNFAVQVSVPSWVQARALGAYQMIFAGGMALGGVIWGFIAEHVSTSKSLMCAAVGLAVTLPISLRFHVLRGVQPDFRPHKYSLLIPKLASDPEDDAGPVRVSIDYHIDPVDYASFVKAIHQLRDVRLRDGAIRWGVYQDAADPGHLNETFVTESWLEYLRQRERFTAQDRQIRELVWSYHRGAAPPAISYMFYAKEVTDSHAASTPPPTE